MEPKFSPQILTSGIRPIQPPAPQKPYIPPANGFETLFGTDLDATTISPREWAQWYESEVPGSKAYGGKEHQEYIANATKLLDMPLIPVKSAAEHGAFDARPGDDMTIRQFLQKAPMIAEWKANLEHSADPKNPKKFDEWQYLVRNRGNKELQAKIADDAFKSLTGQKYDQSTPYGKYAATMVLGAIKAGAKGGKHQSDPTITTEQHSEWKAKYGDEADRMLPPGGVANARREAAHDFLSALQDGPGNTTFDNATYWASMLAPGPTAMNGAADGPPTINRSQFTADPYSPRGRMGHANLQLARVLPTFEQSGEKPYVVEAQNFSRLDPGTYQGFMNVSSNASWPYARELYQPLAVGVGDWGRFGLMDGLMDSDPYRFQVDVANRTQREAPIRFPEQSVKESLADSLMAEDRLKANADYLSTHARPFIADAYNAIGAAVSKIAPNNNKPMSRKPYNWERTAYQIPHAIATSPPQLAMVGATALKAPSAGVFALDLLKEGIDENIEDATLDPANASPFDKSQNSAWMRPYPPGAMVDRPDGTRSERTEDEFRQMLDEDNREAWEQATKETHARRSAELEQRYNRWKDIAPPRQWGSGVPTVN